MGDNDLRFCRRPRSVVGALVAVVLAGCVGPDPMAIGLPAQQAAPATTCGAPSFSCALPFPSDRWQVADASTATGVHLEMVPGSIDQAVLDQLGPRDEVAEALFGSDGFSPLTPIVFQLPDGLGPESVPTDGGDVVQVFDVTSGQRVPVRVEVSGLGVDERGAKNILLVWPRVKFDYGHRIFAGVRVGVRTASGELAVASPAVSQASQATREAAASVNVSVPWSDYLTATSFVVRTEQTIVADVDRLAAIVRADDHPIRNITVQPPMFGGAVTVSGQVRISDFRESDGVIPRDGSATSTPLWTDFMAVLPERSTSSGPAPVAIYGHGITAMKESMVVVSATNASKGIATIGLDNPNHGSRTNEGGHLVDLAYPVLLGRVESSLLQSELDLLSLLGAIQTSLSQLDVLPYDFLADRGGDGRPDLDGSSVVYQGTSLGGVLGATFVGLAPELEGAYLQVPGSGIMDTLIRSLAWEIFRSTIPHGAPIGETHVVTFFAQSLLDRADNTYYLDRIRRAGTPIFLSYAIDDGLVANTSTERMIALLDLPMVGAKVAPIALDLDARRVATMPADGRGYGQIPTGWLDGNLIKPFLTHLQFADPVSQSTLESWLDGRLSAMAPR